MKRNYITNSFSMLFSIFILISCSKDDIQFMSPCPCEKDNTTENGNGNSGSGTDTNTSNLITFDPYVMSEFVVKSVSYEPISTGRYVSFFAYSDNNLIKTVNYKSETAGTVTPVTGVAMYLPNGTYSFYGAGTNSTSNQTPSFTDNKATSLSNGIDYLAWTYSTPTTITAAQDFTVKFNHACTQIVLKMDTTGTTATGSDVKVALVGVQVTPSSTSGCSWDLLTGTITPATTLGTAVAMGMTDNYAQYIMLPLESSGDLTFTMQVSFNGVTQSKDFTAEYPIPSSALAAGNSYLFQVKFVLEEITFTTVDVINWVEVSGGNPVIPTQL